MQKSVNKAKIIFHIDMNAFFCTVATIFYPYLRGQAFAIGRENSYRGVISTASYEARKFGINSAMSLSEAYKIKPDLKVIHIDYKHYVDYHNKFVNVIKEYTDIISVASIDELYADMTKISQTIHPVVLAKQIQERLLREHGLSCSIGIAPTLFLAKMASDIKKPLGVTVLRKKEVDKILYPLSVKDIYGIGKKTFPRLIDNNIKTIGDFMNPSNRELIIKLIGENSYNYVVSHVLGNSSNIVDEDKNAINKSISLSATYDVFLSTIDEVIYEIRTMSRKVVNKLKNDGYFAKTVNIVLRDSNFNTITRQKSLDDYTDDFDIIYNNQLELINENYQDIEYRLVGCGVSMLIEKELLPKEYNLFNIDDNILKEETVKNIVNEFKQKYGEKTISWKKFEDKR